MISHPPVGRAMHGLAAAWLVSAAALTAAAQTTTGATSTTSTSAANCSTTGITVELEAIDDNTDIVGSNARVPNGAECLDGAPLTFRIRNLPSNTNLIVYAGTGGQDCSRADVRNSTTTDSGCNFLTSMMLQPASGTAGFTTKVNLDDGVNCTSTGDDTTRIYFFPTAGESLMNDYPAYGCYNLRVDARPPTTVTGLNHPRGERLLTLEWEPLNDVTVQKYVAFFDNGTAGGDGGMTDAGVTAQPSDDLDAGGTADDGGVSSTAVGDTNPDCPSSVLREGAILDVTNLPDGIRTESQTGNTSNSLEIDARKLASPVVPVAIAAVDQAGNVGPLSEVVCMEIVDTIGFWEQYKNKGGAAEGGCACSAGPQAGAASATPIGLVMLGLWLRARRRRT